MQASTESIHTEPSRHADAKTQVHVVLSRESYLREQLHLMYTELCHASPRINYIKEGVIHALEVDDDMRSRLRRKPRAISWWGVLRFGARLMRLKQPRVVWRVQPRWRWRLIVQRMIYRQRRQHEPWAMMIMDALGRKRQQRNRIRLRQQWRRVVLTYLVRRRIQRRKRVTFRFRVLAKKARGAYQRKRTLQVLRKFRRLAKRARIHTRVVAFQHREHRRCRISYLKFLMRMVVSTLRWMRDTLTLRYQRYAMRLAEQEATRVRLEQQRIATLERIAVLEAKKRRAQDRWTMIRNFTASPAFKVIKRKRKWKRAKYVMCIALYWKRLVYEIRVREMTICHSLTIRAAFRIANTMNSLMLRSLEECSAHLEKAAVMNRTTRRKLKLINYLSKASQLRDTHYEMTLLFKRYAFVGTYWSETFRGIITGLEICKWEELVRRNLNFDAVRRVTCRLKKAQMQGIVMTVWWMWLQVVAIQRTLLRRLGASHHLEEFHVRIRISPTYCAKFIKQYVWCNRHLLPLELISNPDKGAESWSALARSGCDPTHYISRVDRMCSVVVHNMFGPGLRPLLFKEWKIVDFDQIVELAVCSPMQSESVWLYSLANPNANTSIEMRFGAMSEAKRQLYCASEVQADKLCNAI